MPYEKGQFCNMVRTEGTVSSREVKSRLYEQEGELKKLSSTLLFVEARKRAGKLVKLAVDYGVYDVACTCYEVLLKYYQLYEPSGYWSSHYEEKLEKYENLRYEESKVRKFYHHIVRSAFDRNRTYTDKNREASLSYLSELKIMESRKDHGPYFYFKYYLYLTCHYDLFHDHISLSLIHISEPTRPY